MPPPSEPAAASDHGNFIRIPRWVLYVQAGLLLVVPLTCFLLGLAAAQLSRPASAPNATAEMCEVTGRLSTTEGTGLTGVILALPLDRPPAERSDPRPLHPDSFEEAGNPLIRQVQQLGGGVTRTGEAGSFRLDLPESGRYLLVAIAREKRVPEETGPDLPRDETAELSRWFLPLENLFRGHAVQTLRLQTAGKRLNLGKLVFER